MKSEYSSWSGVRKLAKRLSYSWFDVCDILWKTKHHKQPEFKEILLFAVIRKNFIRIKSGKHLRDVHGNLVRRRAGEEDVHYSVRANLDLFKKNYKIKKIWIDKPNFYKSIRQKYAYSYKRFAKEINKHAAMMD